MISWRCSLNHIRECIKGEESMRRFLTGSAVLFLLAMTTSTTAPASNQLPGGPTQSPSAGLVQFALNPQPEPPNIPQDPNKVQGKGKAKAMKAPPKKGDPGK